MSLHTPTAVITSCALVRPIRSPVAAASVRIGARREHPAGRFGRPRPSAVWTLGVWLFNRMASIRLPAEPRRFLLAVRARYAGWRLRRATKFVLGALDDLIILNTRSCPSNLDVLVHEIESRKRHWHVGRD